MTAPLEPESSGGLSTFKASRWAVQVNTGTPETPEWTWWRGISRFQPTQNPTLQDDTDIDSDGFKSQSVTATSDDLTIEGLIKGTRAASALVVDPGAAFVRAKRFEVGPDNEVQLRYWRTDELDDQATVNSYAVSWQDQGGTNEELQRFSATLTGRGKPVRTARPLDADGDGVEDDPLP